MLSSIQKDTRLFAGIFLDSIFALSINQVMQQR